MPLKSGPQWARAFAFRAALGCAFALYAAPISAAPAAQELLPADTYAVVTIPNAPALVRSLTNHSLFRMLQDPSMTPLRQKLETKWREDVSQALERQFGITVPQLAAFAQGQVTLAFLNTTAEPDFSRNWLLTINTRDRAGTAKTNLALWQAKAAAKDRAVNSHKVRGIEIIEFTVDTNDVPAAILDLLPRRLQYRELGKPEPAVSHERQVFVGMAGEMLLVSGSLAATESVAASLQGAESRRLGDNPGYATIPGSLFKDAPISAWIDVKAIFDLLMKNAAAAKPNPQAPKPIEDFEPDKVLRALGIGSARSLGFSARFLREGTYLEAFLSAPESSRAGLLKILAGEPKDVSAPPFIPADAVTFSRKRIDGQKAWLTIEQTLEAVSPQARNVLNFVLDTANAATKDKIPGFDVRKNLIGNLGDDWLTYTRIVQDGGTNSKSVEPARLVLVSSPKPEELATSLRSVLVFITTQTGPPSEREFLGRKIYSVQVPAFASLANPAIPNRGPQKLFYAASGSYVAFSFSQALIEHHLRSADSPVKSLAATEGFAEAAQRVNAPGSAAFSFENDLAQSKHAYDALSGGHLTNNIIPTWLPLPIPQVVRPDLLSKVLEGATLPRFESISNYFTRTVSSMTSTKEGIGYKRFTPAPLPKEAAK